eukprot:SAG25_NODE_281_length_10457_cov_12.574339_8_plen_72_part_00
MLQQFAIPFISPPAPVPASAWGCGASVQALVACKTEGDTPLHSAAATGHGSRLVRALLAAGADPMARCVHM